MSTAEEFQTCKICGLKFKRVASHVQRVHGLSHLSYVIEHDLNGIRPTCACGCGENVTFYKGKFKKYKHSHSYRDKDILEKMLAGSKLAFTPEARQKNSDAIKRRWQDEDYRSKVAKGNEKRTLVLARERAKPDYRQRMSQCRLKFWSDDKNRQMMMERFRSDEVRARISERTKESFTPESRRKISEAVSASYTDERREALTNWKNIKRPKLINPVSGKTEQCGSGWEANIFNELWTLGITATRCPKSLRVPYRWEEKNKNYYPDILLPELHVVLEIKGREFEIDEAKYTAAREFFEKLDYKFVVIRKKDIDLGIEHILDELKRYLSCCAKLEATCC